MPIAVSLILWRVKQKRKGHTQLKLAPSQYIFSWAKDMVRSWRKVLWYLPTILQGNPKKTPVHSKVCLDVFMGECFNFVNKVEKYSTKWKYYQHTESSSSRFLSLLRVPIGLFSARARTFCLLLLGVARTPRLGSLYLEDETGLANWCFTGGAAKLIRRCLDGDLKYCLAVFILFVLIELCRLEMSFLKRLWA